MPGPAGWAEDWPRAAVVREESAGLSSESDFEADSVVSDGCGEVEVTVLVGRCAEFAESSVSLAVVQAASTNPTVVTAAARLRIFRGVFMLSVYRVNCL